MLHLFIFKSLFFLPFGLVILLNIFNKEIGTVCSWKHFQMDSVLQVGIYSMGYL